jgi:hypothetical protein
MSIDEHIAEAFGEEWHMIVVFSRCCSAVVFSRECTHDI